MSIAVVIPTFNAAAFIERTLRSVLEQTSPPDELIVADDASTDNTAQVVERVLATASFPSRLLRLESNSGGPARPFNAAIEASRCEWIATLDHDDEFVPARIELLRRVLPNAGDCAAIIGRMVVREASKDRGHLLETAWARVESLRPMPEAADFGTVDAATAYYALARFSCYAMSCSAMAFPKKVWREVGGFDESIVTCVDYAFLESALRARPLGVLRAPAAYWTLSDRNLSGAVHRRVADVSAVMERIHRRGVPPELHHLMRTEMLKRCDLLSARGETTAYKTLLADTVRSYGWSGLAVATAGKSAARSLLRTLRLK